MRHGSRAAILTFAAAFLALFLALAPFARAGIVGNGVQNFNSIPSGIDFITIHSSETLKPGLINVGAYLNYAVNSLPYVQSSPQGRLNFNDSLLGLDMNIGVGLLPGWEFGLSVPYVLYQNVKENDVPHGEFAQKGNTELRAMTKVRLLGDDRGGVALVGTVNFPRTEDNPYTGVNPGPTYNIEAALDTTISAVAVGFNIGYRFANPGATVPGSPIQPIGNQIIAGAAASYLIPSSDTKLIVETFGAAPSKNVSSDLDRSSSSFEMLAGVKHDLSHNVALHAGMGTALLHGISSPDWRVYTGFNVSFGPVFKSGTEEPKLQDDRIVLYNVLFEFDSDRMTGESAQVIKNAMDQLERSGKYRKIIIEGHTDSIGKETYNQMLSLKRAQAIRAYIVKVHGVDGNRIEAVGKGEAEPIADNGNFQGRQQNRRVEFRIIR